ncbi:hypothetical protein Tco_1145693 [Tanacetum coccineum]
MCTYLKNMEGKKLKDLKNKSFNSIQKMFDRAFKRVNTFVDFRTDLVEGSSKRLGEDRINKEEVVIDVVHLAIKSPSIVALEDLQRWEDLEDLYKLVKAKYESTRPVEDLDLLLWGDLKTMFEPHVEDTVWRNQHDYKVLEWKLYNSYRGRIVRIKSILNAASITAAHIRVNAAQLC